MYLSGRCLWCSQNIDVIQIVLFWFLRILFGALNILLHLVRNLRKLGKFSHSCVKFGQAICSLCRIRLGFVAFEHFHIEGFYLVGILWFDFWIEFLFL